MLDVKQMLGLLIIIIVVIIIVYYVQNNYTKKIENMKVKMDSEEILPELEEGEMPQTIEGEEYIEGEEMMEQDKINEDYYACDSVSPKDLLPKSKMADDFSKQFPVGSGDLSSKNFLTAGYNVGINTVASSLRNANLQLRSDPYIEPKQFPFQNSTILPDMNRKQLEIGS